MAVCLSLLGTWVSGAKGEEWQPGVSTILQVLISIQAMVLCEDPENNEPGYRAQFGGRIATGPSTFTISTCSLTVVYAIKNWATNPPALWKHIAEGHFKKSANKILQTAERWAKESRHPSRREQDASTMLIGGLTGNASRILDIIKFIPELQMALRKYGGTYVIQGVDSLASQHRPSSGGPGFGSQFWPSSQGNVFNRPGAGGMGGFGPPGSRFGNGF